MAEFQAETRQCINKHIEYNGQREIILPLQAIRAIACLAIFMYHGIGSRLHFAGVWGVSVFFILSGFVLVYSHWDKQITEPTIKEAASFSWTKIKKLFPLHVIMLIVGLVYEILQQKDPNITYIIKIALTVPLLQTWFPRYYQALNSVDWYLSVALFLYLVFPFFLYWLRKKLPNKKETLIIMICVYFTQIIIGAFFYYCFSSVDIKWIVYCFPIYRLGDFIIGCILGYLFKVKLETILLSKKNANMLEMITVVLTIISWVIYLCINRTLQWFTYTCLFLPFSGLLIIVFAIGKGNISKIITNRLTLFIAGISSYFFLIHRQMLYYIQMGISYIFHEKISKYMNHILVLLISFVFSLVAVVIYKMIEKKINTARRRECSL